MSTTIAASATPVTPIAIDAEKSAPPPRAKKPYPFWLGGVAATIAASITHPLDLTKVRLQASGDKRMVDSIKKTVRTAGVRGLFDGISGTWMRQMSYSMCRFWAYDESKKILGAGKDAPAWKLAAAGSMAGGIAGFVGNPGDCDGAAARRFREATWERKVERVPEDLKEEDEMPSILSAESGGA